MVDGIRAGVEGMRLMSLRLDAIAANMANASTSAYKKDEIAAAVAAEGEGELIKTSGYVDLSQGELVKTDSAFDLALEGDGFFLVGQGDGAAYTRDGRFTLDASGRLTGPGGLPVQGRGGPVTLDPAQKTSIAPDGSITQNGKTVDMLKIVRFEDPSGLSKAGGGLLKSSGAGIESSARVRQGFLESSNVRMVEEMASMMQVMRGFETMQRAVSAQDAATGKLIASLGRF